MFRFIVTICFLMLTTTAFAENRCLWRYASPSGYFDASPAVIDVDADQIPDLVLASTTGRIMAIDIQGQEIWWIEVPEVFACPPTAIPGEKGVQILLVAQSGKIFSLNGADGRLQWQFQMQGNVSWGGTALAVADLNAGQQPEIIAGDNAGNVWCLSLAGNLLWKQKLAGGINASPAIADLDRDGQPEILLGTMQQPLLCLSNTGKIRWEFDTEKYNLTWKRTIHGSGPIVWDVDQKGSPEILLGIGANCCLISARGELVWQYPFPSAIHDALALGELDGSLKILGVDLSGKVICLDAAGKMCWEQQVKERVRRSPAIADVDGDGQVEILVSGYDAMLTVFSETGSQKTQLWTRSAVNAAPTLVWWKQPLVVLVAQNELAVYAWDFPENGSSQMLWSEYRLNSYRTAAKIPVATASAKLTQIDFGKRFLGANSFQVSVSNPAAEKLALALEILQNQKPLAEKVFSFQSTEFSAALPYRIFGESPATFEFRAVLKNEKNQVRDYTKQVFEHTPFVREIADTKILLEQIGAILPGIQDAQQIQDRWRALGSDFANCQAKSQQPLSQLERRELRDALARQNDECRRILAMLAERKRHQSALLAYAANPWAPFGGLDEIMEGRTPAPEISVSAFHGEMEAAAVNIANFSDLPLMIRVESEYLKSGEQSVSPTGIICLHEVVGVPTQMADLSADALPEMGQAHTLMLPGWTARQLWLRVETANLPAGIWQGKVKLRGLVADEIQTEIPIKIEVWDVPLPKENALNLCHWGYVYGSVLKDQPAAALADKVLHGTNVFVATNYDTPEANFDENGNLVGGINFTRHDAFVKARTPHGQILFFNYQHSLKGPGAPLTPIWKKAHAQWLAAWSQHLQSLGIGYEKWALYPIDEPGLVDGLVQNFIDYAKLARAVDPKIRIYTDPVAGATLDELKKMAPLVDIWCPNRNGYLLHQGNDKLEYLKTTGSEIWTYECEGDVKHQSPLGYYRAQAWLVWHHGLTGIGFWSYCTSSADPWYVPVGTNDYLLIYHGNGVVSSKRWEAIRDGGEDFNLLRLLQEKMAASAPSTEFVRAAKNLLENEAGAVAQFCGLDLDGNLPGAGGFTKQREIADRRWQKIQTVRRQMADLLLQKP